MTETTTVTFDDLLKQREKAKKMVSKWEKKVSELTDLINENCVHGKTTIVKDYVEGGYLNVSEYHDITKCVTCNKELSRKTTYGSYA